MSTRKITTIGMCLGLSTSLLFGGDFFKSPVPGSAPATAEGVEDGLQPPTLGGQYSSSTPISSVPQTEVYDSPYQDYDSDEAGRCVVSPKWVQWYSKWNGKRKAPFQAYNHNAGDLRARPVSSPLCSPTWGYHEPCWRPFPPVPVCPPRCVECLTDNDTSEQDREPAVASRPKVTPVTASRGR